MQKQSTYFIPYKKERLIKNSNFSLKPRAILPEEDRQAIYIHVSSPDSGYRRRRTLAPHYPVVPLRPGLSAWPAARERAHTRGALLERTAHLPARERYKICTAPWLLRTPDASVRPRGLPFTVLRTAKNQSWCLPYSYTRSLVIGSFLKYTLVRFKEENSSREVEEEDASHAWGISICFF